MKDDLVEKRDINHSDSRENIKYFLPLDEFEVTCIRQEATSSGRYRISQLGVRLGGEIIFIDVPVAVFLIQTGKRFYVSRAGSKTFLRTMISSNGRPYVETKEDTTHLNNLKSLSTCREVEQKKSEQDDPASDPTPEPKLDTVSLVNRLPRVGWIWLLGALILLSVLLLILMNPKVPTISFEPVPDKTYLDPDFSVNAAASDGGRVSYRTSMDSFCSVTPEGQVHIFNAGGCAITAYSSTNPRVSVVIQTFTIHRKSQTLTFSKIPDKVYGDPDFPLIAAADSSLPVSFTTSGACASQENAGHIFSAGSCTITAHQPGNENYLPAQDIRQTLYIEKKSQTISLAGPGDQPLSQPFVPISASASSGLPVRLVAADSSICKTDGNVVNIIDTGTCAIMISQTGDENYQAAPEVEQTYEITAVQPANKNDQEISFGSLSPTVFGSPDFAVNASASSGLAVSFTAVGKCSVSGASVKIIGAGSCTITAHQDGDDHYNPAAPVSQSLLIAKATPVIFWVNPDEITPGTPLGSAQLFASAGAVVWNAANPYTLVPGKYTYTPGFGTVLPEGAHPLHVIFTPADKDNYNGVEKTVKIIVTSQECD